MHVAGLTDKNIEFFAKDEELFMIKDNQIISYNDFDSITMAILNIELCHPKNRALFNDLRKNKELDEKEALKQFAIICFGELDNVPDIQGETINYENNHDFNLTPREIEFIKLVCEDLADKEIADKMNITYNTATTYRQNITHKLGVSSKVGIAITALKFNII
jgi:DNA-binding CsgD family transcriptional regulator